VPPIIVWFRDDPRLSDHPALHAAATSGAPVLCLHVLDDSIGPATPIELASAGITLGKTYPHPIIDHASGRERALAAYAKIRKG
jgi:deoxyribodipyrimidine photolyase